MFTQTTPVPNVLFDAYLKNLSSTELKVLLIIIRQTLGWKDVEGNGGRKELDWISGSQLQQKTGCSRRAITTATDALVKKQFIQILDETGSCLYLPEMRQGKTKLFYRLIPAVYRPVEKVISVSPTSAIFAEEMSKECAALAQKMRITKETFTK